MPDRLRAQPRPRTASLRPVDREPVHHRLATHEPQPLIQPVGGNPGRPRGQIHRPGSVGGGQLERSTAQGVTEPLASGGVINHNAGELLWVRRRYRLRQLWQQPSNSIDDLGSGLLDQLDLDTHRRDSTRPCTSAALEQTPHPAPFVCHPVVQRSFLSLEPLLGPLPSLDLTGIDWVIVGGESGPGHRPLDLDWVREIRDRCVERNVALFLKQIGGRTPKAGGRLLDGRTWDQIPGDRR